MRRLLVQSLILMSALLPGSILLSQPAGPEPGAGQLAEFSEVPVHFYTGVPEISIPFLDEQREAWKVFAGLGYHPGKVKVYADAGDCGLGWTLKGGGVITRSLHGLPDETPGTGYIHAEALIPGRDSVYQESSWPYALRRAAATGMIDLEPDVFNVVAPGLAMRIVFDLDRSSGLMRAFPVPWNGCRIEVVTGMKGIRGWRIVSTDGVSYYFGSDSHGRSATDHSFISGNGTSARDYLSAWHLLLMTAPGGTDTIWFDYEGADVEVLRTESETRVMPLDNCQGWQELNEHTHTVTGHRLKTIRHGGGRVEFIRAKPRRDVPVEQKKLDSVLIFNTSGQLLRWFTLHHRYHQSHGCSSRQMYKCRRLMLDSVKVEGADGTTIPAWKFEYWPGVLPPKDSKAVDHWGYFNGAVQNSTLIPSFSSGPVSFSGADRECHPQFLTRQVLKHIVHPPGGITELTWEAHDFAADASGGHATISTTPVSVTLSGSHSPPGAIYDTTITPFSLTHGQQVDVLHHWSDAQGLAIESQAQIIDEQGALTRAFFSHDPQQPFYLPSGEYDLRLIVALNETAQVNLSWQKMTVDTVDTASGTEVYAGGLRIKRIRHYDGKDWVLQRRFYYEREDGGSSGKLLAGTPLYYRVFRKPQITWSGSGPASLPVISGHCSFLSLTSAPLAGKSSFGEAHIAYSRVIESYGKNGGGGSKTHAYALFPAVNSAFYPAPPVGRDFFRRGQLLSRETKRADGIQKEYEQFFRSSSFSDDEPGWHTISGVKIAWDERSLGPSYDRFVIAPYEYRTGAMRLDSVICTTSSDDGLHTLEYRSIAHYDSPESLWPSRRQLNWPDGSTEMSLFVRNSDLLTPDTISGHLAAFATSRDSIMRNVLQTLDSGYFSTSKNHITTADSSLAEGLLNSVTPYLPHLSNDSVFTPVRRQLPRNGKASEAVEWFDHANMLKTVWGTLTVNRTDTCDHLVQGEYSEYQLFGDFFTGRSKDFVLDDTGDICVQSGRFLRLDANGDLISELDATLRREYLAYDGRGRLLSSRRPGGPFKMRTYERYELLPALEAIGLDTQCIYRIFPQGMVSWTSPVLSPGKYRMLLFTDPGPGSTLCTINSQVLSADTINSTTRDGLLLSVSFDISYGSALQLAGTLDIRKVIILLASTKYIMTEHDDGGNPVMALGSGKAFKAYEYDNLYRIRKVRDQDGNILFERQYQVSGSPQY